MREYRKYKAIIIILAGVVILQWVFMFVMFKPKKPLKKPPVSAVKGRIAIVLDDWGYNLNNLPILTRLGRPLTIAVLPNLAYSQKVSEELHNRGFEIILHLPMEPGEKLRLEKNTVMTSLGEASIKTIVAADLENIRYAKGASNHMGSKATGDINTMQSVFSELKGRRLYFLDSFVSSASVCQELAYKMRLPFARRDIFLDNQEDAVYIKAQVDKLKTKARLYGQAIGIGHDRRVTLEALQEIMPELEKEGYKFVFVSDLVR